MNVEHVQATFKDYLALHKCLVDLDVTIIQAFAYREQSDSFTIAGDDIMRIFKTFSAKVLNTYAQIIRETLDDELA